MTPNKEYWFKTLGDAEQLTPTRAEAIEEQKDELDARIDGLRQYRDGLYPDSPAWLRVDKMIDALLAENDALRVSPWLNYCDPGPLEPTGREAVGLGKSGPF